MAYTFPKTDLPPSKWRQRSRAITGKFPLPPTGYIELPRECNQHGVVHSVFECATTLLMSMEPDLFKAVEVPVEQMIPRWNHRVDELVEPESTLYLNQNEARDLKQVFVSLSSRELQVLHDVLARNYEREVADLTEISKPTADRVVVSALPYQLQMSFKHTLTRLWQGKTIYNRIFELWKAQTEEQDNE